MKVGTVMHLFKYVHFCTWPLWSGFTDIHASVSSAAVFPCKTSLSLSTSTPVKSCPLCFSGVLVVYDTAQHNTDDVDRL